MAKTKKSAPKRKITERDFLIEQCLMDAYCERTGEQLDEGWWDDMKAGAAGMASKVKDKFNNFKQRRANAKDFENKKKENMAAYNSWQNKQAEDAAMGRKVDGNSFQAKHQLDDFDHNQNIVDDQGMEQNAQNAKMQSYVKNTANFGKYCKETASILQKAKASLDKLANIDKESQKFTSGSSKGQSSPDQGIFHALRANNPEIRNQISQLQELMGIVIDTISKGGSMKW